MQGEIDVGKTMELLARMRQSSEWIALKAYWNECRRKDERGKQRVIELYGDDLQRALQKYYTK